MSESTSHSKPRVLVPGASVRDWPAPRLVTAVLRHSRRFLYAAGDRDARRARVDDEQLAGE